jgi:hypothetical protein
MFRVCMFIFVKVILLFKCTWVFYDSVTYVCTYVIVYVCVHMWLLLFLLHVCTCTYNVTATYMLHVRVPTMWLLHVTCTCTYNVPATCMCMCTYVSCVRNGEVRLTRFNFFVCLFRAVTRTKSCSNSYHPIRIKHEIQKCIFLSVSNYFQKRARC